VTLGGTGVRAGIALANLGIPSTQHLVSIDDNVRRLMPPIIDWVCSAAADTLDPHLIVQYPAGAVVALADGEVVAPSANRVIVANDRPNREMAIAPSSASACATPTPSSCRDSTRCRMPTCWPRVWTTCGRWGIFRPRRWSTTRMPVLSP
jgi:hypothetical protein